MEWYADEWCITMDELTRDDRTEANQSENLAPILVRKNYDTLARRGRVKVVRQGKGKGNYALISYASLPDNLKERMRAKYPDIEERQRRERNPAYNLFREAYSKDYEALSYYHRVLRGVNKSLSDKRIDELATEYCINASVIQAVIKIRQDNKLYCKVRGSRGRSWADMAEVIKFYQSEYGHTLGASPTRFASWVRKYEQEGYPVLISKKFGNTNTLKAGIDVEKLLIELACDPHRPYGKTVWEWYCEFLRGEVEIYKKTTGEAYKLSDYPSISEKTVGDVLSRQTVRAVLSKRHDAMHDYRTKIRPSHERIKPKYSLSMVTMDDKDFTLKINWKSGGKKIVTALKAYLCYDVASGAIIGWAFSGEKTRDIFEDCLRSMYRNLLRWGLGQPYEAQVENHLVSLYKETSMKSGHLFPEVTYAGAENSQEKYAEHFNRILKYSFEKKLLPEQVGRHYAKLPANRTSNSKANDEYNDRYKSSVYDYDFAVQIYEQIFDAYNNAPNSNPKLYGNKSRLEVLKTCVHPAITPVDMVSLTRWCGRSVRTSINRGLFHANYSKYEVSPEVQDRLRGRDAKIEAYWWDNEDGEMDIDIMHLYQDDVYLEACHRVIPYQVSKLERSSEDVRLFAQQRLRLKEWDQVVEERRPEGIVMVGTEVLKEIDAKPAKVLNVPLEEDLILDEELEMTARNKEECIRRAIMDL